MIDCHIDYESYRTVCPLPEQLLKPIPQQTPGLANIQCKWCGETWFVEETKQEKLKVCPFCEGVVSPKTPKPKATTSKPDSDFRIPNIGKRISFGLNQEWIVVDRDAKGVTLLNVDYPNKLPFHTGKEVVSWYSCSLRKWLNYEYLFTNFLSTQRKYILATPIKNETNKTLFPSEPEETLDKVYIFNETEHEKYKQWYSYMSYGDGIRLRTPSSKNGYFYTMMVINDHRDPWGMGTTVKTKICPVIRVSLEYFK